MYSKARALRLFAAVVLLALSAFLILKALSDRYTVYGMPAEEDNRRVSADSAEEITHFKLVEYASYDGITRLPLPDDFVTDEETEGARWAYVLKTRSAACES